MSPTLNCKKRAPNKGKPRCYTRCAQAPDSQNRISDGRPECDGMHRRSAADKVDGVVGASGRGISNCSSCEGTERRPLNRETETVHLSGVIDGNTQSRNR